MVGAASSAVRREASWHSHRDAVIDVSSADISGEISTYKDLKRERGLGVVGK